MKRRDRSRSLTLAVFGGLLALVCSPRAQAQSHGGLELAWEAPPGCPAREVVRDRVRVLVGASIDNASRLHAEGRIVRSNGRYRLTLQVREGGADSERVIESDSCADLAGAAAVALGLLMRDEVESKNNGTGQNAGNATTTPKPGEANASSTSASQTEPVSKPPPPPKDESSREPGNTPTEPAAGPPSRFRWVLRAPLVGIDVGPLPRATETLGLALGARFDALEVSLGARVGFNQTASVDGPPDYGAELGRATAELRGCHGWRSRRFQIAPCLLFSVDRISASGTGPSVASETRHALAAAAGAGATAGVRLAESWAIVAILGAEVQLTRSHIVVDGLGDVAQLSAFAFAASTGIEWSP